MNALTSFQTVSATDRPGAGPIALDGPVAWITGLYPRATDTFIMREIAGLRSLDVDVRTFSIRRTGPEHHVGPEQAAEASGTTHVLEAARRPRTAVGAHLEALKRPGAWLASLRDAWRTAAPGLKGRAYNLIYWHEAVVLAALLRRAGIVHLHCHIAKASCTVARLAAPLAGVTWSFTLHGPDDLEEPGRWSLRDKIARADFVSCISHYARSQAMLHSDPSQWSKLHVVHCGVEPARYDRPRTGVPGQLLFVGRLAAVKGVRVLLAALSRARETSPGLTLTLVGDGPERTSIEAEARALGLDAAVTFTGYQNQDGVARHLASHAALVLPSFAEGVPVVLMEAMAAGLPVVTTQIAGVPELVEDGLSGRLVPPGDEVALAQALLDVSSDAALAARMGERGRARVAAEFDSRTEARRLALLLRHARSGGPRPARRPGAQA